MSLFIASGTNLGDRKSNLFAAKVLLNKHFEFIAESRIYESPAVDYENQPDFYNQVIEYKTPFHMRPKECMKLLLEIEAELGRQRTVAKGPRVIDLDILFWNELKIESRELTLPHPRLFERSFVVLPLSELPGFAVLQKHFHFPTEFTNSAIPLS
jgi:2-amino-4-hydroxy-6-hydroxymethyldihydropteridine diphosphokinase